MRKLAPLVLLLGIACTTTTPPSPTSANEPAQPAGPYGMTVAEEATILALEDRREYNPDVVAQWIKHENSLHRRRIALALGRIGPHAFVDTDADGEMDGGERRAGVAELTALAADPDRGVREMAAFALGEIGDLAGATPLFTLTSDPDAGVAGEAVEALSKLGADPRFDREGGLTRYLWMTNEQWPEGLRARAVRFLFRFTQKEADAAATAALASTSSAVRQEGAYTMSRRAIPAARPQLELLLSDPTVLTRAYAAAALGRIAEAASVPVLVTALGDSHPWVRTNAAVALSRTYEKTRAAVQGRSEDLPRLLATVEDADPGVRAAIIDTLGYYATANEVARTTLHNLLRNGSQWQRELAAGAIAKQFPPDSQMFRDAEALNQPWATVRILESTAALPHGVELRRRYVTSTSALVRAAALNAIPDERVNDELAIIRGALGDTDLIVRATAIDKFGKSSNVADSEGWLTALQQAETRERTSELNDGRIAAITALGSKYWPRRPEFLRGLVADKDPVVRRVAADLLVDKLSANRPQYTPLAVTRTPAEYEEIIAWSRQPHTATIHMTRGKIELALLPLDAPMTTWNFAQLARRKYFDNTSFMRVVPNFVIQGGDPRNDMNGGPGYAIRDEINLQKYTRAAVGMALSGPDTGGSQFFITHSAQPHLDGGYTIFARAYDGVVSVVDQTERGDRVETITIDERPPVGTAEISKVPNVSLPLVVGPVTVEQIVQTVPSYGEGRAAYQPDITVVEMMKSYVRAGDRVEVYMGTWCEDSAREVPKFMRISDDLKSQYGVELPATFVAVDRSKQQPAKLLEGKNLAKVATFIYYRGDQELGRIEERPTSLFEDDLLTIAAKP
ncbi:MAG TPA: HEAT repeat domain-containing protein [Thermoanaerobaculia bacterium]|jgi:cyclophilin family peptidyl-prolyl cis-trans isomerase/HEAT repeat protein